MAEGHPVDANGPVAQRVFAIVEEQLGALREPLTLETDIGTLCKTRQDRWELVFKFCKEFDVEYPTARFFTRHFQRSSAENKLGLGIIGAGVVLVLGQIIFQDKLGFCNSDIRFNNNVMLLCAFAAYSVVVTWQLLPTDRIPLTIRDVIIAAEMKTWPSANHASNRMQARVGRSESGPQVRTKSDTLRGEMQTGQVMSDFTSLALRSKSDLRIRLLRAVQYARLAPVYRTLRTFKPTPSSVPHSPPRP